MSTNAAATSAGRVGTSVVYSASPVACEFEEREREGGREGGRERGLYHKKPAIG